MTIRRCSNMQVRTMKRQWALVLMGAWVMGTICMSVVATENFYTIDHLLALRANGAFAVAVDRLGSAHARDLLRYLSSELNRLYFQLWNWMQLGFGLLALWLLARRDRAAWWAVVVMLSIVVVMTAWMTPAIVSLGRSLDFVPRDPAPQGMQRFWMLHAAYTTLEMIKLAVGVVVAFWIAKDASPDVVKPAHT
jgi:hypothetical protein